jgi:hypothetical protein
LRQQVSCGLLKLRARSVMDWRQCQPAELETLEVVGARGLGAALPIPPIIVPPAIVLALRTAG